MYDIERYQREKDKIKSRLNEFKNHSEESQFKEFMFCLLTPQSNAQRCWQAVEELSGLSRFNEENVLRILKSKTRFYITKAHRILRAKENFEQIKHHFDNNNTKELRNFLADSVDGYGLKESSHFLRNIGKSNNEIAILDRHILRNLHNMGYINETKIKNRKHYFEIEDIFLKFAKQVNIPADELDLLWWSKENGEIFK